jgi:hypothetical protein
MSKIKSFRGQLAQDEVRTIALHTNDGSTGYRIKKFEVMGYDPIATDQECVLKIFSISQDAATQYIDFEDNTLIAAAFFENEDSGAYLGGSVIVFDNVTFNQDIYITHKSSVDVGVNYHIELEQVKLDLNENTVATLKDIRNIKSSRT